MNGQRYQELENPTVWLRVDPETVKQRLERITERLEKVRRKEFESQQQTDSSHPMTHTKIKPSHKEVEYVG